jgi:hypothetical protein
LVPGPFAATSARKLLLPPPERDGPNKRTKDQDRAYAEWLFDSSSNIQRCLVRAVAMAQEDPLGGVDEVLFITHWIVKYLHHLGSPFWDVNLCRFELFQWFET